MTEFKLKLKALLHDPPHKVWAFENVREENIRNPRTHSTPEYRNQKDEDKYHKWYEIVAEDLFRFIIDECIKDVQVNDADSVASAMSRIIVSPKLSEKEKKNFENKSKVGLSEAKFIDPFSLKEDNIENPATHDEVLEIFRKLGNLNFKNQEERGKLLFFYLWRFLPEIFPWIEKHPSDTRAPNHSNYEHLVQTSAVVSSLPKPAFLLFTIGPVQEFISTARKTSDLWAGSYMLSYLIYKAIEVLMENFGPDHIIFPALIGQPLVDGWLYNQFKNSPLNEFVRDKTYFKKFIDNAHLDENLAIANFPNRFLAILPYEKAKDIAERCKNKIIEEFRSWADKVANEIDQIQIKEAIQKHLKDYFKIYYVMLPWGDDIYGIDKVLEEYKSLVSENKNYETVRIIKDNPYYPPANVGFAYSLLVELTERFLASRKLIRETQQIDEQKEEKCHLCGNFDVLNIDWGKLHRKKGIVRKSEKLCGVCLTKRYLSEIIKNTLNLQEEVRFPSTSEMATVKFKTMIDNQLAEKFKQKFEEFKQKTMNIPSTVSVPKLRKSGNPLKEIDGEWLFEESYRKDYSKGQYYIEENLKDLFDLLNRIGRPDPYYAILYMDGDNIGKWLKGEMMPKIEKFIHPKTKEALIKYTPEDKKDDIEKLLKYSNHPMSASFHFAFSRRLSKFALEKVRNMVEEKYYGKLIYAGGDDVLAFLPKDEVLDCAYDLQNEFKNILGENASMSAGIVIVHHKYPLSLALKSVREAEEMAKDEYGKNAFCLCHIKHSGEIREFGGNWDLKEFLKEFVCKFKNKEISSRFGYEVIETIEKLFSEENIKNIVEIIKVEIRRIYKRKFKRMKENEPEKFEEKLVEVFEKFSKNPREFGNMLIVASELV